MVYQKAVLHTPRRVAQRRTSRQPGSHLWQQSLITIKPCLTLPSYRLLETHVGARKLLAPEGTQAAAEQTDDDERARELEGMMRAGQCLQARAFPPLVLPKSVEAARVSSHETKW